MLRFVIQFLIPIALAIFAVVDCVLTPRLYVRALPKSVWILLILVPYVGALLWIFTGRGVTATAARGRRSTDLRGGAFAAFTESGTHERRPGPATRPEPTGRPLSREWSVAPDDDPEFLRKLAEQMRKDRPEG